MQLVNEATRLAVSHARLRPADEVSSHVEFVDLSIAVAAEQILVRER